ncbi:hypothetical protein PQR68_34670 [Paraburkholderia agricolaris]|uniref:RHS repeat-associated core domain-containing protein n=1 Tax=Paraburkholderia agricolaris TaxID=2152888 RepID=UPI00142F0790|nr:RHS repeat-associated core domain-containing protein [Paraburkholderia agricolaris]
MYYYLSRYYSPATGRFFSEDPVRWASGQTNAYAYAGGNPVQFNDRSVSSQQVRRATIKLKTNKLAISLGNSA